MISFPFHRQALASLGGTLRSQVQSGGIIHEVSPIVLDAKHAYKEYTHVDHRVEALHLELGHFGLTCLDSSWHIRLDRQVLVEQEPRGKQGRDNAKEGDFQRR